MNKQYRKGYVLELKVKKYLEKLGYLCFRSAGSHSVADIVAINNDDYEIVGTSIYLIQCKAGKGAISKQEVKKLIATANKYRCIPILAISEKGKVKFKSYERKWNKKFECSESRWYNYDIIEYSKNVKMT